MAKKNYVRCDAYHSEIKSETADKALLTIKGRSSKGADVEINVVLGDYFFPYMIREMAKIARQRVSLARTRLENVKNAVIEND